MRHLILASVAVAALAITASPAMAQRDPGGAGMGRTGFQWQTEQALAKEKLAELKAGLNRMSEAEWMEEALAWISYDFVAEGKLQLDDSLRVATIDPGKKAEVEVLGDSPPTWGVAWGRKPPRELELTLTDTGATKLDCSLAPARKLGKGYIGVFQHEGVLLCLARGPFEESVADLG